MNMNVKKTMLFLIAVILLGTTTGEAAVPMPDFSLPSAVDGKNISSESFKGKVLLITFFATWCPPCRQEIPSLIELHRDLGPKGFSVLGISVDEGGAGIVNKLVKQEKINYPVVISDSATPANFGGVAGIPTSFLINRKGHVVKKYPGFVTHKILQRDIEAILK